MSGERLLTDSGSEVMILAARPQNLIERTMFFPTPIATGASSAVNPRSFAAAVAYALRNHP